MRWYSPFDWIPGPETEEEVEELRRLRQKNDERSEESSATIIAGMNIVHGSRLHFFTNVNEDLKVLNSLPSE